MVRECTLSGLVYLHQGCLRISHSQQVSLNFRLFCSTQAGGLSVSVDLGLNPGSKASWTVSLAVYQASTQNIVKDRAHVTALKGLLFCHDSFMYPVCLYHHQDHAVTCPSFPVRVTILYICSLSRLERDILGYTPRAQACTL